MKIEQLLFNIHRTNRGLFISHLSRSLSLSAYSLLLLSFKKIFFFLRFTAQFHDGENFCRNIISSVLVNGRDFLNLSFFFPFVNEKVDLKKKINMWGFVIFALFVFFFIWINIIIMFSIRVVYCQVTMEFENSEIQQKRWGLFFFFVIYCFYLKLKSDDGFRCWRFLFFLLQCVKRF